jgi:hypothetical protein
MTTNTEWQPHDGTGMPVDGFTLVTVRFRNDRIDKGFRANWYAGWAGTHDHWAREGGDRDIVAYRVHTPAPEQGETA